MCLILISCSNDSLISFTIISNSSFPISLNCSLAMASSTKGTSLLLACLNSSIIPSTASQSSSSSLYAFLMLSHFLWKLCNSVLLPTPSCKLMRYSINSWIISPFSGSTFLYFQQDCLYLWELLVETFLRYFDKIFNEISFKTDPFHGY